MRQRNSRCPAGFCLLSDHLKGLPFSTAESSPEKRRPDHPVQAHGKGNANDAQVHPDGKNHGKDHPAYNSGKQTDKHGKPHISGCPESIGQGTGKGIKYCIEQIVDQNEDQHQFCGLFRQSIPLQDHRRSCQDQSVPQHRSQHRDPQKLSHIIFCCFGIPGPHTLTDHGNKRQPWAVPIKAATDQKLWATPLAAICTVPNRAVMLLSATFTS